jgi:hypothetical protein
MFRNPTAHEARISLGYEQEDAEDLLSLASVIHRRLDESRGVGIDAGLVASKVTMF